MSLIENESEEIINLYYFWKKCRGRRQVWTRQIFLCREQIGEFHRLIPQLREDPEKFYNYYRMTKDCYSLLISRVKPLFVIGNTNFRKTISFEERLTITLRYLATGDSYHSLSFRFRVSHNKISVIISHMLTLIYEALADTYLKFPNKEEFKKISDGFFLKKKFPNCIGAIDGKHVRIHKPNKAGSLYYNYKLYHSIILLAVVDVNYNFLMIDVGSYGKNSDSGVLEHSAFGKLLHQNKIDLPDDQPIDGSNEALPSVFVGDEAFRLSEHLMKPYPRRELDIKKRRFNYRLSFARQTVECAFGILVSKFRIFETSIKLSPDNVDKVIKVACVLHNMIRVQENYCDKNLTQDNMTQTTAFEPIHNNRSNNQSVRLAREVREKFCNYFSEGGSVEWQDRRIQLNDTN